MSNTAFIEWERLLCQRQRWSLLRRVSIFPLIDWNYIYARGCKSSDRLNPLSFIMHEMVILWRCNLSGGCMKQQIPHPQNTLEPFKPCWPENMMQLIYSPFLQRAMNMYTSTTTPHNGWCVLHTGQRHYGRAVLQCVSVRSQWRL